MAEAGAKVLNAQAVEFAKEKGIAIYARATGGPLPGPDPSSDGTVVRERPPRMPGTVVGVASERDVVLLESQVPAADLLALLDERGVAGKQLHIVADRTKLVISRENLHDEARLREALDSRFKGRAQLVDGLLRSASSAPGSTRRTRTSAAGADALAEADISCRGAATSSFRITWMVPRERTDEAVRALHRRFIEPATSLPAASPEKGLWAA